MTIKEIFARNLVTNIQRNKKTQLDIAQYLQVSPAAVSAWCKGQKMPRMDKIERLANYFGIQKSDLIEDKSSLPDNAIPFTESHQAPIVGSIPAGYPALAFEDIEGYASIPYADVENYFFLRVKGDSMINANIHTGDLVLIRKQECAEDGQIVAARVNGDEATLKRYKKQGDTVLLLPENPAYEPKIVPLKEFDIGYAQIIGVAIEVRHML